MNQADKASELARWVQQQDQEIRALYVEDVEILPSPLLRRRWKALLGNPGWCWRHHVMDQARTAHFHRYLLLLLPPHAKYVAAAFQANSARCPALLVRSCRRRALLIRRSCCSAVVVRSSRCQAFHVRSRRRAFLSFQGSVADLQGSAADFQGSAADHLGLSEGSSPLRSTADFHVADLLTRSSEGPLLCLASLQTVCSFVLRTSDKLLRWFCRRPPESLLLCCRPHVRPPELCALLGRPSSRPPELCTSLGQPGSRPELNAMLTSPCPPGSNPPCVCLC
ncbi:hypothetical protein CRENBAI_015534 [Crenichthys baileyi]|uniref:Uncharacterized protein n=1 Tax=Crenichthys baileyi TaxID=28760 RepID=A0AAV9SES7_9TELE